MKQKMLVSAMGLGLATMMTAGLAVSKEADGERVWIGFEPGHEVSLQQSLLSEGATIHHEFPEVGALVVTLPAVSISSLSSLSNRQGVRYVEPDHKLYPMSQITPYGIDLVQARDVWDANRDGQLDAGAPTGKGITVCVIDSGLSAGHQDFAGMNVIGGFPTATWNVDRCGHGSHVAGTIAAANNGKGVVGVSPGEVSLYILKVFGNTTNASCDWTYSSSVVDAANRCAAAGASVINMSLGGGAPNAGAAAAFQNLLDNGVLSIAAAGNAGNTSMSYPASYDAVVSVAAVDQNRALAGFSQRNAQVEVAAPGVGTLSTVGYSAASLGVSGSNYMVGAITGTVQTAVSGDLVEAGKCLTPLSNVDGKVVLCERGDISFADKALNAQAGGAVGVAIYNNAAGGFSGTFNNVPVAIPGVSVSREDGLTMIADSLGQSTALSTVFTYPTSGYDTMSGTSMASPHAAGVAAVIWSEKPSLTAAQVRQVMSASALDLGTPGRNHQFGHGLVQLADAIALVRSGETPEPPPPAEPPALVVLQNGVPVTGLDTPAAGDRTFSIDVPAGTEKLDIKMSGGTGDADLHVKFGAMPTTAPGGFDCRPYFWGNDETCTFENPEAGTYFILLDTYEPYAGVTLVADILGSAANGLQVTVSGARARPRHTLAWSGGSAEVDVYRNGQHIDTLANSGTWSATVLAIHGASEWMVCNGGTDSCSNSVTR